MKIKVLLNGIINYAAAVALAVHLRPNYIGAAYKALHDKVKHRV